MLLSDRDMLSHIVRGDVGVDPFDPSLVQPASLDMRLGPDFRVIFPSESGYLTDTRHVVDHSEFIPCELNEPFTLMPGMFVLAQTLEQLTLPDFLAAKLEGKSSLGRLGLVLHATAGFIDPGFSGTITLELSLCSPRGLILHPGMKIGQLAFYPLTSPARKPYGSPDLGSKYQGQTGPQPSRYAM